MRELSLSILDLAQNSIRCGASTVIISIIVDDFDNKLTVSIEDDGCGMGEDVVDSVLDPFYTTCVSHKVGLGVPLFIQRALMTGGSYKIHSSEGVGTVITAVFNMNSVDSVPLGDVAGVVQCLVASAPDVVFVYDYHRGKHHFHLDTEGLFKELGIDGNQSSLKLELIKAYLADKIIQ